MKNGKDKYAELMAAETLSGMEIDQALDHLALLIDLSHVLNDLAGLQKAFELAEELQKRELKDADRALLHYFLANAWSNSKCLKREGHTSSWDWEQEETEKAIIHLRTALQTEGFLSLHEIRQCQILTNLGNA
jgi:hypothetical protein